MFTITGISSHSTPYRQDMPRKGCTLLKNFKLISCILITPQRRAAHVSMALLPQPVLASSGTQAGSLCRIARADGVPEAACACRSTQPTLVRPAPALAPWAACQLDRLPQEAVASAAKILARGLALLSAI